MCVIEPSIPGAATVVRLPEREGRKYGGALRPKGYPTNAAPLGKWPLGR